MKTFYSFCFLVVAILVAINNIYSQDDQERWSTPITKLKPTGETVEQPIYKEFIPSTEYRTYDTKTGKVTVSPNIRMYPTTYTTQSEMAVSLHPTNPNIVFAGSNAAGYPTVNWISQGWYITTNGGTSWFGGDTLPPHQMAGMSNYTSDPVTAIDLNNNLYFNTILYSSTTGDIVVSRSTNWGQTWTPFTALPDPGIDEDKNWMAVDIDPGSPYAGNIYVAYTDFNSTGGAYRRIRYARSTNQGASFTPNPTINISGTSNYLDQGVNITTGPNGEVYICWTNYITSSLTSSNIGFTRSTDGGVTFSTPIFATTNIADIRGTLIKGGNSIRVNSFPFIAVDRSNGPYRGNLYIVYPAKNPTRPDIFIIRSTNGGTTWSTPTRVNQADNNLDQWFSSVAVDPATGFVYVVYYDSRNFPANDSAQVYLSRSTDGGQTFEDILVSDRAFLPRAISGLASGYMGDYIDVKALNGIVWPVWNDNRTGYHQAYTAKVIFGPTITHTPLTNTENLTGPYTVTAEITSSIPLDPSKIKVYWGRTGTITDSITMTNTSGDIWTADIPGNGLPATYQYYIYAADNMGGFSTSPPGAPSVVHSFEVGIDNTPPTVVSTPLPDQYRETWPAKVSATVTDNIGIDSVWVEWQKNDEVTIYKFRLELVSGSLYEGYFDVDSSFFAVGDSVLYKVYAMDNSSNHNIGYTPATGYYKFNFIPDTEFPVITHTPLRNQPEIRWPASVRATVTDNLGVDSVWVEYYLNDPLNSGKFYLLKTTGNNYEGIWNLDTTQIQVGDSIFYKVVARDISNNQNISYHPITGEHKFYIISTKGLVLVVDDDGTAKNEKGGEDVDPALKGVTGRLIQRTLTDAGYIVDTVSFALHNPAVYPDYDIVVWTGGTKGSGVFGDATKRDALRARVASGGKVWVEGGEVGYVYRWQTTELDKNFRQQVLHDSNWVSDVTTSNLVITQPTHPIFNVPNPITGPIAFTGTSIYSRDAMRLIPGDAGAYKVAGWSYYTTQGPDTCALIVFDNNPNPLSAQIVFMPFALNSITDTMVAKKLIENTAEFLLTPEAPPTGAVVGTVTLTGTSDYSGVNVQLIGFNYLQTQVTGTTGEFSFTGLYPGNYTIKVWKAGYYPTLIQEPVVVGTGVVTLNYTLDPIVPATISGVVTLQGTSNYRGVKVEIVGTSLNTLTNTLGEYTITGITPGNIKVRVSKPGWKTAVKDTSVGNGGSLVLDFYLETTPGNILVVDNDDFASRIRPPDDMRSSEQPDTIALGGSSRLFYNTLTEAGYNVDLVAATAVDTSSFINYDVVIWACGRAATVIDNQTWRTALINRVNNGLPVLIEGGDVAYYYRVAGGRDPLFRTTVLRINNWLTDSPGNLALENPSHPIATTPNTLPSSYTFNTVAGIFDKDGVSPLADAQVVYNWTTSPATNKGILAYGPNPTYGVGAFFPMNINNIVKAESTHAKNLIINTINFLKPPPPSSISGMKFNDLNGNGVKDEGEPPLANWRIKLSGAANKSTLTDEEGNYSFTNLMMGTYTVSESLQVGWTQTYPSGGSYTIILASGIDTSGFDFGNMQLNSISGMKFNDLNGNGVKDGTEPGLSGWKIFITGDKNDSTVTDGNGNYSFNNLLLGNYTISERLIPGWKQTYPSAPGVHNVSITTGGTFITDKNFGNYQLASISGLKFDDLNGNGEKDDGEAVISNWKIYLNGNLDSTLTDENGAYSFSGLELGTYIISEELQPGWVQTSPSAPGTYTIEITTGGTNFTDKNFGNFKLGTISGMKFNDLNNNGIKDAGEPGFDGWKIYIGGARVDSVLTALNGNYLFDNLFYGTYIISEEVQPGWVQTMPASGTYTIQIFSGTNSAGNDFGNFFPADTVKYRTFVSDSLAQLKPVKMKPDKVKFCASFTNTSMLANGIRIKFDQVVTFTDIDGFTSQITTDGGKTWDLRGRNIANGEQVTVCGIGNKGKNIKVAAWWWIVSGSPTDKRDGFVPAGQQLLMPMPNWANARIETFNKITTGIVVGKAVPESVNTLGWVKIMKQADMAKSLKDKTGIHNKGPKGFDKFENGKPFVKEQKNLAPSKHNNKLFAEALTLRFNIITSALGITTNGFGELIYDDGTTNPLNGYTISQIDSIVNNKLTFYKNVPSAEYENLYTTIKAINEAFAGPIDTVSTKPFVLKGVRQLRDVPFLKVSELPPFRLITTSEPVLPPQEYRLGQNYPNPFNPLTTIEFDLPEEGLVTLKVYNLLGQEVATLLENEDFGEGSQEVAFDASGFASGVYFYRIIVKDYDGVVKFQSVNKMLLLK